MPKSQTNRKSKKISIAFTEVEDRWEKDYLNQLLKGDFDLAFYDKPAQSLGDELKTFDILSVFIKSKLDRSFLNRNPSLQFICTRSTGYDHIDVKAAKEKGIPVSNVPTYGENTVAEHTFALILSLSRRLRKAYLKTLASDFSLSGLMGFDLKGKTLGVVGTGHIGLHVIRIGVGFGMKVLAYDVQEKKFLSEVLGFEHVPFEELLAKSDIISLNVPYLPSTHHMINEKTIRMIKKGAVLINTARGGLIDTNALVKALDEGILSGAGLDVLEEEEFILEEKRILENSESKAHWDKLNTTLKNHVLLHRENVIYTPHMAFCSREAIERILDTTAENIRAYLNSHPVHLVC